MSDAEQYHSFGMRQIPVVAVGALFLFGGVVMLRRKMQGQLEGQTATSRNGVSTVTNATTTGQARELTAADLTGATPPTTTTTTATTTTTTRRQRRPRRTPSQVSTKSLPAYMKEPGDHEVVIYRYVFKRSRFLGCPDSIINEQWPGRYGRRGRWRTSKCK